MFNKNMEHINILLGEIKNMFVGASVDVQISDIKNNVDELKIRAGEVLGAAQQLSTSLTRLMEVCSDKSEECAALKTLGKNDKHYDINLRSSFNKLQEGIYYVENALERLNALIKRHEKKL